MREGIGASEKELYLKGRALTGRGSAPAACYSFTSAEGLSSASTLAW